MTCYKAKGYTAPLHIHTTLRDFFDCKFLRGDHITLILKPLGFFFWEELKDASPITALHLAGTC
jgi:hypothetical protein